ncbi:MAG: glutamine-hydrolyzing carbamoyl-phosphate synthase small subunit [Erysipelotrichaceae bacterium]|nr:glutamine-hydrolyzing carbamoyl-phosphate synthase small subunit [Erysipelotrichaceae bacterium]
MKERKLVLANGTELLGKGFGSEKEVVCEVVFNTSVVGYQEILSNPSYTEQILVMTYPLIGNYGIIDEDYDSKLIGPKGLIVREYNDKPSNFRYTKTLNELLEENNVAGLTHLDTRKLTRILRDEGNMTGIICDAEVTKEEALAKIEAYKCPTDLVARVSCRKKWYSRCANPKFSVVVLDCGVTYSLVRELNRNGCNVTVVPYDTSCETILSMKPDGVVVAGGPGNPQDAVQTIETLRQLQGKKPLLGISLGAFLIALANGMKVEKMKTGRHGGNHPVRVMESGRIEIVSLNHDWQIVKESIEACGAQMTHVNLLDDSAAGFEMKEKKEFAVVYTPDAAAGPQDCAALMKKLVDAMKGGNQNA